MGIGSYDHNDVTIDPQWAVPGIWKSQPLMNGSSHNMNVNGSVTPVNFSFTPGSGEIWYVHAVSLVLNDNGTNGPNKFGALTALTNGVQMQVQSKGVTQDICNIKDNLDLAMCYFENRVAHGTVGFFETADVFTGSLSFNPQMILQNSTSDYIRIRIRDNLTGVDFMRACVHVWKANQ